MYLDEDNPEDDIPDLDATTNPKRPRIVSPATAPVTVQVTEQVSLLTNANKIVRVHITSGPSLPIGMFYLPTLPSYICLQHLP